jgi:ribonuclease-3
LPTIVTETCYRTLEKSLAYHFRNPQLLAEALRHRSFVNEHPETVGRDNERLEFLGDAVLNLVVSHVLMQTFPDMTEGDLSRTRAHMVNETYLAQVARTLSLGPCIQLGRGEAMTGGHDKPSILSDTLEAVIAAIYLDGGFQAVFDVIGNRLDFPFETVGTPAEITDYKSRLQERLQTNGQPVPQYRVVSESGPDHDKTFTVEITLQGLNAIGTGRNKKAAEQQAAREALARLAHHD